MEADVHHPEPVPAPSMMHMAPMSSHLDDMDSSIGKWRPMSLKVKLGGVSDEPEVEEGAPIYQQRDEPKVVPHPSFGSTAHQEDEEMALGTCRLPFSIH